MLLYKSIRKHTNALHLAERITGSPIEYKMDFTFLWLGVVGQVLEVEILESKEKKGWLYSNSSLCFYKYHGNLYECMLWELRELAETLLKAKKYDLCKGLNTLYKENDGRVIGHIAINEVLTISKEIKDVVDD